IPSDDLDDPFSDQTEWPRLSCPQVNQLALEFGELRIDESLTVNNAISTNQLSVIGSVTTPLTIDNILTVNSAIATNQLSVSDSVMGSLTIENDLTVNNAIATNQLSVSDSVTGSLKIENNLTLGGKVGIGITTPEAELHVIGKLLGAAQDISGKALRICCGKTPEGSTNWQPYRDGTTGIYVDIDTSVCGFIDTPIYIVNMHGNGRNWETTGGSSPYDRTNQGFRIYVRFPNGAELTPSSANTRGWHIQWIAIGN
ncbi:MAG: hypothetical protein QNJ72_23220, partial [Pleurocapsa sp. MO_226.B13]|nr:hypothetical protein [Pleurocapsa sp. MO_226.B13]